MKSLKRYIKVWTESEMAEFISLFPTTPNKELMVKFNCTYNVIRNIARNNGLKKSKEYWDDYLKNKAHNHLPKFKKGQESWCKGTKGVMNNGNKTRFTKGQEPHNKKPIGHISRSRDHLTIKTEQGVKQLQRYIWELHYGEIPPRSIIRFKDGNKRNFDIENLELCNRAYSLKDKHPLKYPEDIRNAILIKREITKYINKYGKKQNN